MADNVFEILIKYGLDPTKAREAQREMDALKKKTKEVGEASEEASEKGSKGAKEHTKHIEGLHKATGLLFRQFGELGHLLHGFVSLPALGITAVAVILSKVAEHAAHTKKAIQEAGEKLDAMNISKVEQLRTALTNAAVESHKLVVDLEHAGDAIDAYANRKFTDQKQELQARVGIQDGLETKAKEAQKAATDLGTSKELRTARAELKQALDEEAKINKEAREAQVEKLPQFEADYKAAANLSQFQRQPIYERFARARDAKAAQDANQATIARNQGIVNDYTIRQQDLDAASSLARGQAVSNKKRIAELSGEIQATDSAAMNKTATESFDIAQGIAHKLSTGGKWDAKKEKEASRDEKIFLRAVASNTAGQNLTLQQAVVMMENSKINRDQLLERLIKAMETYGGVGTGLDARLRNLESQMQTLQTRR